MTHYCGLCARHLPNERFSGGGHRIHVCRNCQARPAAERSAIEARLEIEAMLLRQSHISDKNLERLRRLSRSPDSEIAKAATIVLQVGAVAPYKRKRLRVLQRVEPRLVNALVDIGLLEPLPLLEDAETVRRSDEDVSEECESVGAAPESVGPDDAEDIPF